MPAIKPALKINCYGCDNGRIVVYFHGAPGAPEECAVFDQYGKAHGLTFICLDRFSIDSSLKGEAYFRWLAVEILKQAGGQKVDIIGFSIGAFIALQACRYLVGEVRSLHLVSAAAPLEAGDFLKAMAGKRVFQLARTFPAGFILLSYWQGLLALLFPKALYALLFASAAGADRALAADAGFQDGMMPILKSCFTGRRPGYAREIDAYVLPWASTLGEISVNTTIWHGSDDNWSPPLMANYLKSVLPNCRQIAVRHGLSHYSCLYESAAEICRQLHLH